MPVRPLGGSENPTIYVQSSEPTDADDGDIWIETSA